MKKLALVPMLAAATLLLAACGGPNHGVVKDKRYTPASSWVSQSCSTTNKVQHCHPVNHYSPASYALDVYASKDDHGWVEVPEATYLKLEIGDTYGAKS